MSLPSTEPRLEHPKTVLELLEQRTMLATVTVDLSQTAQTMRAIGGNFAAGRHTGSPTVNDAPGLHALEYLSVERARIGIPLRGWEPVNDNADPSTAGTFVENNEIRNVFLLMQDLQARGIPITASVWNAPDWLVSNPTAPDRRLVPAANYPEVIESITTFLTTARDKYGVTVDAVSFNEPDGGYNLKFTAQEYINFVKQAGPVMADQGLEAKWLVGDTSSGRKHVAYASEILKDADAAPYLGALSFHGWGALSDADSIFTGIRDLAQQYGKEVWCEEVGYDALLYNNDDYFKDWPYAAKLAKTYYKILKLATATVADYWEYQDDYPLVSPNFLTRYPASYVVQQIAEGFTPGTQLVAANSDDATILAMAGNHALHDAFMLQLINTATVDAQVTIAGLPADALTLIRSSATQNGVRVGKYNPVDGSLTLTLPADSVSTLRNKLALPSPWHGRELGATGIEGHAHHESGTYALRGGGSGLGGDRDSAFLITQLSDGDAQLTARLVGTDASAEAGVMIRGGTGDDAAYVALTHVNGQLRLTYRGAAGGAASVAATVDASAGPHLRLLRQGDEIVAFASTNGTSWTTVGSVTVPMGMTTTLALMATGNDNAARAAATFDNVAVVSLEPMLAPTRLTAASVSNTQVDLTWTDHAGAEINYEVQRSADNGATWSQVAMLMGNMTSWANTGRTAGTTYWYRVRARNVAGRGAWSAVSMIRTPTQHEAESAKFSGAGVSRVHGGYSGGGYVAMTQADGGYVEWTVDAPYAGTFTLQPRYSQTTVDNLTMQVSVDGVVVAPAMQFFRLSLPTNWLTLNLNVKLTPGPHVVRITSTGTAGVNLDRMRLRATVPARPSGVVAQPRSGGIRVAWTPDGSVDDEVVRIERSADGVTFTEVGKVAANGAAFFDADVDPLTEYVYQLRASNAGGDSAYSTQVRATAPESVSAPAAPTGLSATAVSSSRIDLSWTGASDGVGAYVVAHSADGVTFRDVATLDADATAYAAAGLAAGTRHYFRVRAVNGGGASDGVAADAVTFVIAPATFTVTAAAPDAITLSWGEVVGASGYRIERSPDGLGDWTVVTTAAAGATSYIDSGLADGTRFHYRVTALGGSGDGGAASGIQSAVTQLSAPEDLSAAAAGSRQVNLSWGDVAQNESGYIIERADGGGTFAEIGRVGANAQSYADTTATPLASYTYRVRGFNGAAAEGLAATATAATPADPLASPVAVFVNGTAWHASVRNHMATTGVGDATYGYRLDANQHLDELPWVNLNQISVRFSEAVKVTADDLTVRGVRVADYGQSAALVFAYDAATFTATWTLANGAAFGSDKVLLDLNADAGGVTDARDVQMDGEWANAAAPASGGGDAFPAGNGTPGGDFRFRLNVLPGDADRTGGVTGADVAFVRSAQGGTPGAGLYSVFKDIDGSGGIVGADVALARSRQGSTLPLEELAAL